MAKIARELVKHKKILEFSSNYEDYLRQNTNKKFWLVNTNKLIKTYSGMDGLKTGYTENALYCLTATANRNNMRLIGVLMGEPTSKIRNEEMSSLLDYGFNLYETYTLLKKNKVVGSYYNEKSSRFKTDIILNEDIKILKKKDSQKRNITYDIKINELELPIEKGSKVGIINIKENNKILFTKDVVVNKRIKKANIFELYIRNLTELIDGSYLY